MKDFKEFLINSKVVIFRKKSKIPMPNLRWDKGAESIAGSNLNSGSVVEEEPAGIMGHGLSQVAFLDKKKKKKGIDQFSHLASVNQSPAFSNYQLNIESFEEFLLKKL